MKKQVVCVVLCATFLLGASYQRASCQIIQQSTQLQSIKDAQKAALLHYKPTLYSAFPQECTGMSSVDADPRSGEIWVMAMKRNNKPVEAQIGLRSTNTLTNTGPTTWTGVKVVATFEVIEITAEKIYLCVGAGPTPGHGGLCTWADRPGTITSESSAFDMAPNIAWFGTASVWIPDSWCSPNKSASAYVRIKSIGFQFQ